MTAYYNEIDKHAAAWLRNLIAAGHIAPGDVDERSITEVSADDLRGYTQCHFFAGIGGWSYALRLAGWPDDRPVWTGSCPCQPFSAAGKQRGSDDERHLWPAFFDLIRECGPRVVIGEQVAGAAGYAWWDHVAADLEGEGYAAAAADIGAHSVGAPHLRQRLYWVAHGPKRGRVEERANGGRQRAGDRAQGWAAGSELSGDVGVMAHAGCRQLRDSGLSLAGEASGSQGEGHQRQRVRPDAWDGCDAHRLADTDSAGSLLSQRDGEPQQPEQQASRQHDADGRGEVCGLGNAGNEGLEVERRFHGVSRGASGAGAGQAVERANALAPWSDLAWIECSDGKARPTQPGLFPLAHGVSGRVGRLRAYGNAIVPQVAAAFVKAAAA